ncbi:TetR/AcrR family transcriptional regulator [Shewanella surugensis]|uniref:TetR/AcrR family transcriptional regulator n=1 Tax=Shewanella surugensis TaxID=212020 RepID=A0ABT0L9V8_9GAMM|nr:TetR/AcrR family transcriptional regulator [Shewanella surugensis]MCL1124501.1 TetR/AcrR family transcriptional regulator [Shewanella surugensis]
MLKVTKKQIILDTALALFVHQGFYGTSTALIAKQAGVATGTLFHHFHSKDELMQQLFLSIKQDFADTILLNRQENSDLKQEVEHLWNSSIQWALDHPLKQAFFQQYSLSTVIPNEIKSHAMNSILKFIGDFIALGQQAGLLAKHPITLMQESCHGQYLASTRFFLDNPEKWHDTVYRQASFSLFWRSIASVA